MEFKNIKEILEEKLRKIEENIKSKDDLKTDSFSENSFSEQQSFTSPSAVGKHIQVTGRLMKLATSLTPI